MLLVFAVVIFSSVIVESSYAFSPASFSKNSSSSPVPSLRRQLTTWRPSAFTSRRGAYPLLAANNNDDVSKSDDDDADDVPSDATLLASLQSRLAQINTDRNAVLKRWRKGKCSSSIRLSLDDWVRRIDMAQWPLAVVGSAGGSIYLADLSLGISLVKAEGTHDAQGGDEEMLELMFGQYDGGGTIDVAVGGPNGRLAASCGREGGALAWKIGGGGNNGGGARSNDSNAISGDNDDVDGIGGGAPASSSSSRGEEILECLGELAPLAGLAVTCLKIDGEGRLWAGCYDGTVHCIHLENLIKGKNPKPRKTKCDSAVLSIDIGEDIDLVAVGTATGSVDLFFSDEDLDESDGKLHKVGEWTPRKGIPVRSVAIAPFPISLCDISNDENDDEDRDYENEDEFAWSLVSGGTDGCLHAIPLNIDCDSDVIDEELPLGESAEEDTVAMQPPHNGPVTCISWRKGGILVSAAQDGTIRVWDSTPRCASDASINQGVSKVAYDPRCLYGLGGYKVWLGSISTAGDGLRLLSDGADNTIIVHNFSAEEKKDDSKVSQDKGNDDSGSNGGGNNTGDSDIGIDDDDEAAFM